jgi:uncharacterized protein YdiU (UPF0061 family)
MENPRTTLPLSCTYSRLPSVFYALQEPEKAPSPQLFLFNIGLAKDLGLQEAPEYYTPYLSGNEPVEGVSPLAQAYAGHQFGHFTLLGDGRALLLGEIERPEGERFDLQLKGAGQTPYSRRGDGKATLKAMLREYVISEALWRLEIPSTRSLAVVVTGSPVFRERTEYGAILSRIASSHLRVGTFEYARYFTSPSDLSALLDYAIKRHYPSLLGHENPALAFLNAVAEKQIRLVVEWERVGFIHGVMNTDNTTISGESIDFGPCAFMNQYDPLTVFSSIDTEGRYAFGKQGEIILWNLSVFAGSLLPLIHKKEGIALELVRDALENAQKKLMAFQQKMRANKLGFEAPCSASSALSNRFLNLLQVHGLDYTNSYAALCFDAFDSEEILFLPAFDAWRKDWESLLSQKGIDKAEALEIMQAHNPSVIPRNETLEEALQTAADGKGASGILSILDALKTPYQNPSEKTALHHPPTKDAVAFKTYCGT